MLLWAIGTGPMATSPNKPLDFDQFSRLLRQLGSARAGSRSAARRPAPPSTRSCWTVAVPQPRRETTDASLYSIDDWESGIDAIERELR